MEQVTAYKASDGSLFATEEQAKEHEFSLVWRQKISAFMASEFNPYKSGAQYGMAAKVVLGWEQFKIVLGWEKFKGVMAEKE